MEKAQWVEVVVPESFGDIRVMPSKRLAALGAHSLPETLHVHLDDFASMGGIAEWTAHIKSGRVSIEKLTWIDESGLMVPTILTMVLSNVWPVTFECYSALTGATYESLWEAHLEAIEPREGKTKGQWVACLWRNHFEPQGWSMVQLADRLGLTHKSVLTYASRNDPTRETK
jgi:hypothetical protein